MPNNFNLSPSMPVWNNRGTARPQGGLLSQQGMSLSQQEELHRRRVAQLEAERAAAKMPKRLPNLAPQVQNLVQQPQHIGGGTTGFIGGPPPIDKRMTLTSPFPQQVGKDSYEHRMGVTQQPGLLVGQSRNAGLLGRPQAAATNLTQGMGHEDFLKQMQDAETLREEQQGTASGEENEFSYIEQGLGLPPGLLYSLMMAETEAFPETRDTVKSSAGAQGAFQLMPQTAERYGANRTNRHESAIAAGREIKWQLGSHNGDLDKALASYNYGHGNFRVKAGANLAKAPKETKKHRERFHKYFDNFGSSQSSSPEPMTLEQKFEQNTENTNTNQTP